MRFLLNLAGVISDTYTYDAYGKLLGSTGKASARQSIRIVIKQGVCQIVEIGIADVATKAVNEAGLYLFFDAAGKLYGGQTTRQIATRLAEHGVAKVRYVLATFHV